MREKSIYWILGMFLVFGALFTVPFLIQNNGQVQDVEMAAMESTPTRTMSMDAAEAAPPEPSKSFPWASLQTLGIIAALSIMSTFLSWAMVDKVMGNREDVVLMSFKDDSGKNILEAMSNETCRKILEELSDEELTASQLSKNMDMSIQRVHYNIKKLEEAGLVESKSYKYSSKGNEMDVYKITKKYFIFGPE